MLLSAQSPLDSQEPYDPFNGKILGPYIISDQKIGSGSNGEVRIAFNRNGAKSAVKIVNKSSKMKDEAMREVQVLHSLQHENIIQLEYYHEDEQFIYIFTQLMEEGDLYSYMQSHGILDESQAFQLFKQMISALEFCHEHGICHHDVKLENCVIDKELRLRVIDFGYAVEFSGASGPVQIRKFNGSPAYSAPEILFRRSHNESIDVFSAGVCLYYMLAGRFPFCDEERSTFEQLCRNVKSGCVEFPVGISLEAQELMNKMLQKDNRISWAEIRQHPWFRREKKKAIVANLFLRELP